MSNNVTPKIFKVWSTPDPRRAVAMAARVCYTSKPIGTLMEAMTDEEVTKSVTAVLQRHHTSTLRHAVYMFAIGGVSRTLSHQLVRHGPGHAFEQRSQHYRTEKGFDYFQPDTLPDHETELDYGLWMEEAQQFYDQLIAKGVPKEDAREVLPNGVETVLVWTANLEAIMNFISKRACRVNTKQIEMIAVGARRIVLEDFPELAPFLGPTCWSTGICYEGQKFFDVCRKPWQSPTVLWTPEFPRQQTIVYMGGGTATNTLPVKPFLLDHAEEDKSH